MREGSPSIFSSNFCIVAHRHRDGFDLLRETKNKPDVIEIEAGRTSILSREAQIITMVQDVRDYGYKLTTKIVAWEELQKVWISAFCDGDSPQSFQSSEAIFAGMTRIKAELKRQRSGCRTGSV